jgi:hypothetical protein
MDGHPTPDWTSCFAATRKRKLSLRSSMMKSRSKSRKCGSRAMRSPYKVTDSYFLLRASTHFPSLGYM